jgi:hypothetical protein
MLNKHIARYFSVACTALMLTSCGDSKAVGTGQFATVSVTATALSATLDSDFAGWVDTTGTKATPCLAASIPTILPDDVVFNITSTPYTTPNTGSSSPIVVSDLAISNVTLTFTPANSLTPALPARFQSQPASASPSRIISGANSVTVRVVTDDLKSFLQTNYLCTGAFLTYRVSVTFDAIELNTNRASSISLAGNGYLTVNLADFTDK